MANELVKTNGSIQYTADQVALIKSQIAPKANDSELKLFMYQCQRSGLDPFTKQIYAIHRWNGQQGKEVMSIQTSIDGFRVIAERSGVYAGQGEPEFIENGKEITCCKVRVFKFSPRGERYEAAVGVAYWDEYKQTGKDGKVTGMWAKMPHVMLSKVAEAIALRKAFPQDLSGLYTNDEMSQAETVEAQLEDISKNMPTMGERQDLVNLLENSTLDAMKKAATLEKIGSCTNYETYNKIKFYLEDHQQDPVNPSQKDINKVVNKKVNATA